MNFLSLHLLIGNGYKSRRVIVSVCLRPLTLGVCVVSLSLCALVALLRDSPNCCNNCFSSDGGLEVCESQSIRADLKKRHQMPGLWAKSQTMCIIYRPWAPQMFYKWHQVSRPVLDSLTGLLVALFCQTQRDPNAHLLYMSVVCFKTCLICVFWGPDSLPFQCSLTSDLATRELHFASFSPAHASRSLKQDSCMSFKMHFITDFVTLP